MQREYECIVFGATGYTGEYCARHITTSLPTDFEWAVAGRNESKLKQVVADLTALNPDRKPPGIEIAQLRKEDLVRLAKKTKVLITTVGPYVKYGSAVLEACAETGTHYLDVTGEIHWVYDMVHKYHDTAKRTGAIIIPQNGVESAPADLMSFALVSHIRKTLGVGTAELINVTHELNSVPSGGTLASAIAMFEECSLTQVAQATKPWSLCAIPAAPQKNHTKPLLEMLTGLRTVRDLGILATSIQGPADTPIVHRTWSLYDGGKLYGPNFHLSCYTKARNYLQGFFIHMALILGFLALLLPPVRWLLKKYIYQPGEGVDQETASRESIEWRAIAYADTTDPSEPKRAYGRIRWDGSMYHLTGMFLAEAAITIAREKTHAHELGGGMLTPACLGMAYLERVQKAGLKVEIRTMP